MNTKLTVKSWLDKIAGYIEDNQDIEVDYYDSFYQSPEYALILIDLLNELESADMDEHHAYYSACILSIEACVAYLQSLCEIGDKKAQVQMQKLMAHMAKVINHSHQGLNFWIPTLNAFYEVHAELSASLKTAYFGLTQIGNIYDTQKEPVDIHPLSSLLEEMAHLSPFDIAENFFAQSYAMPPDFFADFILDLCHLENGLDIAVLCLLHPKAEIREVVVQSFNMMMDKLIFTPKSLSRVQAIKLWYPQNYHETFERWIKIQRKKGVIFESETTVKPIIKIKASEIDGVGAQSVFIQVRQNRQRYLCSFLFKYRVGIKGVWVTPHNFTKTEMQEFFKGAGDESLFLRNVSENYLLKMTNHFLAISIEQGDMPDLHLLEVQEILNLRFISEKIDSSNMIESLMVAIQPCTHETIYASLKRSARWLDTKSFAKSWFAEDPDIDKLVNNHCSFVSGEKICDYEEALQAVMEQFFEKNRDVWVFHFLWVALWLNSKAGKQEKAWQDSAIIAYLIDNKTPLFYIPLIQEICLESIQYSIDTMHERRTHLTSLQK